MCVCVQVLQKVGVVETLRIENHHKLRVFKITFHFLPPERYSDDRLLSPQQILHYMETRCVSVSLCHKGSTVIVPHLPHALFRPSRFFRLLLDAIKKRSAKLASIAVETRRATARDRDDDGNGAAASGGVCFFFLFFKFSVLLKHLQHMWCSNIFFRHCKNKPLSRCHSAVR